MLFQSFIVLPAFVFLGLCLIISSIWHWYLLFLFYVPAGDNLYFSFLSCPPAFFLGASCTILCLFVTHYIIGVKYLFLSSCIR